LWQYGASGC